MGRGRWRKRVVITIDEVLGGWEKLISDVSKVLLKLFDPFYLSLQ